MAINVAVVGLGKMGLSHLAIVNALEHFNVVAMCDTSGIVGGVLSKYTKIPFQEDFDKLIALPGLQAVIIATPTTTHDWMSRKAIERGLHVFCEKPLTLSSAVSRELAEAAGSKDLVTQVGYHNRFIGTFGEVKKLIEIGAIGQITHVQAEAYGPVVLKPAKPTWRGKAGGGGGCLYDYAAHPLNLLNWYFGEATAASGALLKSGFSAEVDDEVYATLGFADGTTGQLSVNWSDPSVRKMTTRITIWGTGGRIYADRQELQAFLTGTAPIPESYRTGWTTKYITELTPPVSYYLRGEEYSAQMEAFGDAIVAGKGAGENSFASAALTDVSIEMIRASAQEGGGIGNFGAAELVPRKAGLVGRMLGR
ncbi:MAG: Gfo/Idh/MocA family oxidoreductase [Spirochaetia bacterium]|nr:MAG: Gfo/Idh/MocA family oxidoreductase [Spirochaetia bacterium]